ncbi:MAG TPA: endolytic transglycosylase MltG [Nocardioides sp.]|uniref:endolytic transglycosylase MltG n=1 Tax=Nocardioides sp. TaxID=35761 RepID=UPI002BE7E2B7|nr:endolytic transglycosylase MltG [Nocardioides sp.]HQR28666.1 endolytic transglycosylase MltG [Nocardioides sp.]
MSEQEPYDEHLAAGAGEVAEPAYVPGGRRRRRKRRSLPGCLAVLVALAVLVGGIAFGVVWGVGFVKDRFADPADYPGPGHGRVLFEVQEGDTATDMGRGLTDKGVVASVQAFTDAASANPDSRGIQVGFYRLRKEMKAEDALAVLVDSGNLIRNTVTVPEGLRVTEIVDLLAGKTDFSRADYEKVLARPESLGLPEYAEGNPEGYLFPATYDVGPKDTPQTILTAMVDRWRQAAEDADLEQAADRLGYTPAELMTVASLVQAEARGEDMPKVARVIYNRLAPDSPTNGLLQIDATVNYAHDRPLGVALTQEDLAIDSPFNTYRNPGLPPTPIESPGDDAIRAATNPADGDWYYYVTVNLRTGETKFAETYPEFLRYKAEFQEYCLTSKAC